MFYRFLGTTLIVTAALALGNGLPAPAAVFLVVLGAAVFLVGGRRS
jgi:hypothetical protein